MLTVMAPREVSSYGVQITNTFSIKANGKAFKVLIDGLYSDKIRAVVRELWTNAYDSHVMANKADVPFDCHLPTFSDPTFTVRDYGVSLSDDGVMHLYTTVFESSKEDTNTQVGKLGLGSKSPFAYTDTFTITAWLDGRKRTYSAYIGADYVPQISRMSDEASDEPQGFAVSFPVKTYDYGAFASAARGVVHGFDVIPVFTGSTSVKPDADPVLFSGNGWKLFAAGGRYSSAQARQGCVIYPLSSYSIPNLSDEHAALLQSRLLIDFDIGLLEISANREALGYDAQTCTNIRTRLDQISAEMHDHYVAALSGVKTYWEFMILRKELANSGIPDAVVEKAVFNGFSLKSVCRRFGTTLEIGRKHIRNAPLVLDHIKLKRGIIPRLNTPRDRSIYFIPGKIVVYVQDPMVPTPYTAARIAAHYSRTYSDVRQALFIKCSRNSVLFKRLNVIMGRPPEDVFVFVHDIPKPESAVKSGSKPRAAVKELASAYSLYDREVSADDGGYYMPLAHGRFLNMINVSVAPKSSEALNAITQADAWSLVRALKGLNMIPNDAQVYGIPATRRDITNNSGWVSVWDIAREAMTHFDATKAAEWTAVRDLRSYTGDASVRLVASFVADKVMFPSANSVAAKTMREYVRRISALPPAEYDAYKHYDRIIAACYSPAAPEFVTTCAADPDISFVTDFNTTYSRVSDFISGSSRYSAFVEPLTALVIDYIRLVDAAAERDTVDAVA